MEHPKYYLELNHQVDTSHLCLSRHKHNDKNRKLNFGQEVQYKCRKELVLPLVNSFYAKSAHGEILRSFFYIELLIPCN